MNHINPSKAKFNKADPYAFEELRLPNNDETRALLAGYDLAECLSDEHGWLLYGYAAVGRDGDGGVGVGDIWLRDDDFILHLIPLGPLYWSLYWAFDTQFSDHVSDVLYGDTLMPRIEYSGFALPKLEAA